MLNGCELSVHIGIDFTLSNGIATDKQSLHYLDPNTSTNDYTEAITACLSVLENFSPNKKFPAFGFGGILPDSTQASHCFALNGDIFNPECDGINGVLQSYASALNKVQLYGGT